MATKDDISRELDSMKIVALYRVRGGTAQDRGREATDLSGAFYMCATQHEGLESAIWLKDPGAPDTIDWSKICSLTNLGNELGYQYAQIITLPDPLNTSYTTYQVSEEQLVINLLPSFVEIGLGMSIDEKRRKSLQWIVESQARRKCVVNWSAGNVDATCLPYLPDTIVELKLCGMPKFLTVTVPWKRSCNRHHWLHDFVSKLRNLEKLTLSGCGYSSDGLSRLRGWTGSLDIRVDEEEK